MACPICGREVPQPSTGRPRTYCSQAHRQRAYEFRQIRAVTPPILPSDPLVGMLAAGPDDGPFWVDQFDLLIVRNLDRFSRKLAIYAAAADELVSAKVALYEFEGDGTGIRLLDLTDADSRAMADMKQVFAQLEKAQLKRRVRQAKQARRSAGLHPGGKRSYGYELVDTGRKGNYGPIMELRPHPLERVIVVRMHEMALATSQRKIARILNDEGITSTTGGRWTQSTVARVLGNPLYIGKFKRRVGDRWELYDGQHEPIVDQDLWERVNRSRATPERRAGGRPLLSGHLLTRGLLRCGGCGSAMIPTGGYGGRREIYICIGRRDHGPEFCRQASVRGMLIDEALLSQLTSRYFDLDGARDRLRRHQASELPLAQAALADAAREVMATQARITRVDRGWQDEVIDDASYKRQSVELTQALTGAQRAVSRATRRVEQIEAEGSSTDVEEALLAQLASRRSCPARSRGRRTWRRCGR